MGSTCASIHLLWRGSSDDAVKAIGRAYAKLGYERVKNRPAESSKHVIVLARAGEGFISFYDSTNAHLDSGELKEAALEASRLLKTGRCSPACTTATATNSFFLPTAARSIC